MKVLFMSVKELCVEKLACEKVVCASASSHVGSKSARDHLREDKVLRPDKRSISHHRSPPRRRAIHPFHTQPLTIFTLTKTDLPSTTFKNQVTIIGPNTSTTGPQGLLPRLDITTTV